MRFLKGAEVFNAKGELVGSISRVVIDAKTREITDLVVVDCTRYCRQKKKAL